MKQLGVRRAASFALNEPLMRADGILHCILFSSNNLPMPILRVKLRECLCSLLVLRTNFLCLSILLLTYAHLASHIKDLLLPLKITKSPPIWVPAGSQTV